MEIRTHGTYFVRVVDMAACRYPRFLRCDHGCTQVIQLINGVSEDIEFELCSVEAEQIAGLLLEAIDRSSSM